MSIQVLSSAVIDKIAAGEVLERPAQLIKELVENSLDAGADEVEIDVSEDALSVIVKDNGCGIAKDEMPIALSRHATSKIQNVEDLFALSSYGFRGEALSSAAAVSRLSLTSRTKEMKFGSRLTSNYGVLDPQEEISAGYGCEIQVSGLFENVPARKKFLKSAQSELSQIKLCVKSFAMARPDVTFKLTRAGEILFFWSQTDSQLQRVKDILGLDELFQASAHEFGIQVDAFYAAPNVTLRQNRGLWIFTQGRWIQDRALGAAVMEAYRNLLMHGEYPHCCLFLKLNPEDVDVNVHPTKSQVRFANPSQVFRAVVHTLRESLQKTPWLKQQKFESLSEPSWSQAAHYESQKADQMTFLDRELKKTQIRQKDFVLRDSSPLESTSQPIPTMNDLRQAREDFSWQNLQVIGQMAQTYILAQSDSEFYLVDQHAAHERVVFERLMRAWKEGRFVQQRYLIPLTLDFSGDDVENLILYKADLEKMGVEIEQAGPETVAINAVPEMISESGIAKALRKFADQLQRFAGGFAVETAIADIFASMSCHSVVRAGQSLSENEMKGLLEQMDEFPFSSFCPHGRPVYVKKSFYQIEKEFGRIV